jgi:phenylacetate-CoA ligase
MQNLMISMRSIFRKVLREGPSFQRLLKEVEKTQWLGERELKDYQLKKIRSIIQYAANKVPYYRRLFQQQSLRIDDFSEIDDLKKIPCLEKKDIISNSDDLVADNVKGFKIKGCTSGTTGTPITIIHNLYSVIREHAFTWRQLHWAGYRKSQRRAWIRGDMIVSFEKNDAPYWRFNQIDNMLMMSSYHLSEVSAPKYITALESFDPVLIQAYPSSIAYLARYLDNSGRDYKGPSLRAIVTSSETLLDEHREAIERRMNCSCFDSYGHYERAAAIHTCENGNYHINSDYGFIELFPDNDGTAEIVGTGFGNRVMPLLRYKTGDRVIPADGAKKCPCGRKLPLVEKILGRMDDSIKTIDGRSVVRLAHIYKGLKNVMEAQIVQKALDRIQILIVPYGSFDMQDEKQLRSNVQQRLGKNMGVDINLIPKISRSRNGKLRNIISTF